MIWMILLLAGVLEVAWATFLKYTEGFTRPLPTLAALVTLIASIYCLSLALRTLPLSTAYAIWVGIGVIGAAIMGLLLFNESVTPLKLLSLALIVAGIVGLKLSS